MNTQKLLILTMRNLWSSQLSKKNIFDKLNNPKVGDYVMEITSLFLNDLDKVRIGKLLSIDTEGMGRAEIELPNGEKFKWANMKFIKIPDENLF